MTEDDHPLAPLIERLSRLEDKEGDSKLDHEILTALGAKRGYGVSYYWPDESYWDDWHITDDVNAALALCERIAPDLFPGLQKRPDGWGAELVYPEPRRDRLGTHFALCSDHNRFVLPASALTCAVLRWKVGADVAEYKTQAAHDLQKAQSEVPK